MTRIFYDFEFIEYRRGWFRKYRTIDPISIGMVAEDGRELYLVNRDMPVRRIRRHPWLMDNVVPGLPKGHGDQKITMPKRWLFHYADRTVQPREVIADRVREFIQATPDVELWADFGAYDHVCLAWLFGSMIDLPDGVPMFTADLQQEMVRLGVTDRDMPSNPGRAHNALDDARQGARVGAYLATLATAPQDGLSRVQEAVRKARGGEAPPTARGFA